MKEKAGRFRLQFLVAASTLVLSMGCGPAEQKTAQKKDEIGTENFIAVGDPHLIKIIGDAEHSFSVLGRAAFEEKLQNGDISAFESESESQVPNNFLDPAQLLKQKSGLKKKISNKQNKKISPIPELVFGMPRQILTKSLVFGSAITKVSDQSNEDLGDLKLGDIPPFLVKLRLQKQAKNSFVVSVLNCGANCAGSPDRKPLFDIPALGIGKEGEVYVDLSSLGNELDLVAIRKDDPVLTRFKSTSSQVVKFDYSKKTLVFDVEAHLVDTNSKNTEEEPAQETVLTNRWYFTFDKFNPRFISRKGTPGVGFFMTEESSVPLVQRWDFDHRGYDEGIKYYIKHVPSEWQPTFAGAFEEWNAKLLPLIGKTVFSYEFISEGDPRDEVIVAGDVRFNVLEWDLVNKASYGGLGPSLAHPYTGETFNANVLIQGPTVIDIYSKWFNAHSESNQLRAMGKEQQAEDVLFRTTLEMKSKIQKLLTRDFEMKLGSGLQVRIRGRDPSLKDPIMSKDGFDPIPDGYDYQSYMAGYFHDMVAHELGHNLGLRHNFRGNLGALAGSPVLGGVSRSIMEYLGKGYRHLDTLGEYDLMAISYGYLGKMPAHTDWYCTDEDEADLNDGSKSAECSSSDATDDPFSFFEGELSRALDLLLARGQAKAPSWVVDDMIDKLYTTFAGLGTYAVSAKQTSTEWTNFFHREGRPTNPDQIRGYVLEKIHSAICDPGLLSEVEQKESDEAKSKAQQNLTTLRVKAADILRPAFSKGELECSQELARK